MDKIPRQIENYTIGEKIAGGSFGAVYFVEKQGRKYAIKFEPRKCTQLAIEIEVYKRVRGKSGIPNLVSYGHTEALNFVVLDLLGPSIAQIFKPLKTFGLSTVCNLGAQILDGIQALHDQRVVHSDLKPENVAIGIANPSKIYLFDFGLSKIMPNDLETPLQTNTLVGTVLFMSDGAHKGIVSYRNDIESLAYMLAYWKNGTLPWDFNCTLYQPTDTKMIILQKAHMLKLEKKDELFSTLPPQIAGVLKASNDMSHTEKPNFSRLKDILLEHIQAEPFDWEKDNNKENVPTDNVQ